MGPILLVAAFVAAAVAIYVWRDNIKNAVVIAANWIHDKIV